MSTISVDNYEDRSAAQSVDSVYVVHGTLISWVQSGQTGVIADSLNVSGVTDDAAGRNTVSYITSFLGINYASVHKSDVSQGEIATLLTGSTGVNHRNSAGSFSDVTNFFSHQVIGQLA